MKLIILGSSSKGNCYLLEANNGDVLMIECGVDFKKVKEALQFKTNRVVTCLISHEHQDHCKYINYVMAAGIDVLASTGTHNAIGSISHHRAKMLGAESREMGEFKIRGCAVNHDVAMPLGFLIYHPECGNVIFITDTYYVPFRFKNLNNIIIEANYSEAILEQKGGKNLFLKDRIIQSHMSLETCLQTLEANDLSQVNNIVLIHLSDSNSNALDFKSQVEKKTGKTIHVAESGMTINFNISPF